MGQTAVVERSQNLYEITQVSPEMMLCCSAAGAVRLLNRNRSTIWTYVKAKKLRSFSVGGNVVIPLADVAVMLNTTETQVYNIAIAHRIPLWQIYRKG